MGKYALLIGVETYGEGLQPLPAAPNDVRALQDVLLNPEMGGFDEAKPLINPSKSDMEEQVEEFLEDRQQGDLVLLFFSGHGVKDNSRDLYFGAANTRKKRDRLALSTAIRAGSIYGFFDSCQAKYKVIILDCCFSGAFGSSVPRDDGEIPLKEQLGAEGWVVLASTSAVDYSFEEKDADLSIYTRYLVEGIATGAADENSDGVITIDELHCYTARKVQETSPNMSPTLITLNGEGFRIQVARSPQDDSGLKYRKEAELRAGGVEFTVPARRLLDRLRRELGLSDAEAENIEEDVLKPHVEYQRRQDEYQRTLRESMEQESPLSERTINDLKDYRAHLGFNLENVVEIERTVLDGRDLKEYIADLKQVQETQPQVKVDTPPIDDLLKDLKNLDYHKSRYRFRACLSSNRRDKKIGIFYLDSSDSREITWHFCCLLKEFFVARYHEKEQIKRLHNADLVLSELCQKGKNKNLGSSEVLRNIYSEWKIVKRPTLILVENRICPDANFSWETIVEKLVLLCQEHPGIPLIFWFFDQNYSSYIKNNRVKNAFTKMEAAINASSDSEKFSVINFSEPTSSTFNEVQRKGTDNLEDLQYNEGLRDRIARILQVDPTLISTVFDGMNPDQYSQETGYEVWKYFFKLLDKTTFWEDIQAEHLPCRIEL